MDVKGEVVGSGNDERVHLAVTADKAGRVIGKRGSTLGAIRHLLSLALEQNFGDLTIDVDVDDDRPKGERPSRSSDSSGGRGRRRDRDSGRRSDGRRSGGRRPRSRDKGKYPEEKLRALARKAGEKAAESGQTITINLELNSYDRRLVHLEISEMEGVESQSEEREGDDGEIVKYVQVIPLAD
jgi:predicted RNA-binding protein Jag